MDGVKRSMGLESSVNSLTYKELQDRRTLIQKRMQDQREILLAASTYVKPGGRLLYATCSFLMEEDEDRVA